MKKLLAGLFVLGFLFTLAPQVHASALSDALLKIQNLTKEIAQLQSKLKASAGDVNLPSITNITTIPSWSSLELKFSVSSPAGVTEVGYCLKKVNNTTPCVRNVIRGLSSYSDARINIASIEPTTNYTYYLYAKNSYGESKSSDINFTSLVVAPEAYDFVVPSYLSPRVEIYPALPTLTSNTASVGGHLTSFGTTGASERGACYGSSSSSAINCITAYLVQGPHDMFATKFTGLTPDTTYYYRVYAKNSTETVYSSVSTFKTLVGAVEQNPLPNLIASKAENMLSSYPIGTVELTGSIINNGTSSASGIFYNHFELKSSLSSSTSIINTPPVSLSSLAGNGTSAKVSYSSYFTSTASYSVRLCADQTSSINNSGTITESNESDNCGDWTSFVVSDNSNIGDGCSNGEVYSSTTGYKCPVVNSCSDSDGGININVKGFTDGRVNGTGSTFSDVSVGSNGDAQCTGTSCTSVAEGYCENGNVTNKLMMCPSGYSVNGVCAEKQGTPSIKVLSPNGSETYTAGQQILVKWQTTNLPSSSYVVIQLMDDISKIDYKDDGRQLTTLNDGEALFTLPVDQWSNGPKLTGGKRYKIGMWNAGVNVGGYSIYMPADWSDNLFTINSSSNDNSFTDINIPTSYNYLPSLVQVGKEITLSSGIKNSGTIPATAEFYNHFELTTCASTVNCNIISLPADSSIKPTTYLKEYVGDMSTKYTFNKTGTFNIRACADQISLANNKGNITESDELNNCGSWQIIKVFDDSSPYIKIVYPQGGETYQAGQEITVKWQSQNIVADTIGIMLSSSVSDTTLVYPTSNDGIETVTLPKNMYGNSFKIFITNDQTGGAYSNYFTIKQSITEDGCLNGEIFSSTTGQRCLGFEVKDNGCYGGNIYSITTGKLCIGNTSSGNSVSLLSSISRTLKLTIPRMTGNDVKLIQRFLELTADGVYGRGTAYAVSGWQAEHGLVADGTVGPKTLQKMIELGN